MHKELKKCQKDGVDKVRASPLWNGHSLESLMAIARIGPVGTIDIEVLLIINRCATGLLSCVWGSCLMYWVLGFLSYV